MVTPITKGYYPHEVPKRDFENIRIIGTSTVMQSASARPFCFSEPLACELPSTVRQIIMHIDLLNTYVLRDL